MFPNSSGIGEAKAAAPPPRPPTLPADVDIREAGHRCRVGLVALAFG